MPFVGVTPGMAMPLGQIELLVTFGMPDNFRTEKVIFDVADSHLPYNGILGRPALAKFMAVTHYAYLTMKMPGPKGPITIETDLKAALYCAEKVFDITAAARQDCPEGSGAPLTRARLGPDAIFAAEGHPELARREVLHSEQNLELPQSSGSRAPKARIAAADDLLVKEVPLQNKRRCRLVDCSWV